MFTNEKGLPELTGYEKSVIYNALNQYQLYLENMAETYKRKKDFPKSFESKVKAVDKLLRNGDLV